MAHRFWFVMFLTAHALLTPVLQASPATEIAAQVPVALRDIYAARQFEPLWTNQGQPTPRATAAIQQLAHADDDGLHPQDYNVAQLEQQLATLQKATSLDPLQQATFDLTLSAALAQYTSDMTAGRILPRSQGLDIDTNNNRTRLPTALQRVLVDTPDMVVTLAQLQPTLPVYGALRQQLSHYRMLAHTYPHPPTLPPLPGKKLEPGMVWSGNDALASWLVVLGDLASETVVQGTYSGALVDGVKRFQTRHGLTADGIIGKQTWEALHVPLPLRVQQIELAMERLRWLDAAAMTQQRFILINIPQFTLWAYSPIQGRPQPDFEMRVVVGQAGKNETPVMTKTLSSIVFNPYWNVPRSIAMKELLPKLRRDPSYLLHEDMEWVDRQGHAQGNHFDPEQEDRVVLGEYRIRQRSGNKNALGKLKFVFPNDDAIYMHDTPSKNLFAKDRRDFSHGCIRVGDPTKLALFVLQTQGDWDDVKLNDKISHSKDQHVALQERLPVLVLYLTANTDAAGNALFFPDIYQHDAALAAALNNRTLTDMAK